MGAKKGGLRKGTVVLEGLRVHAQVDFKVGQSSIAYRNVMSDMFMRFYVWELTDVGTVKEGEPNGVIDPISRCQGKKSLGRRHAQI